MSAERVTVLRVDPYHPQLGALVFSVIPRLFEAVESFGDNPKQVVPAFLSRLFGNDQNVILVAAVNKQGVVKGFASAVIDGGTCLMLQPRLDEPTVNDAVSEMVSMIEDWAKVQGFKAINLVTKRLDTKWSKKFDFEVSRYILSKELV